MLSDWINSTNPFSGQTHLLRQPQFFGVAVAMREKKVSNIDTFADPQTLDKDKRSSLFVDGEGKRFINIVGTWPDPLKFDRFLFSSTVNPSSKKWSPKFRSSITNTDEFVAESTLSSWARSARDVGSRFESSSSNSFLMITWFKSREGSSGIES